MLIVQCVGVENGDCEYCRSLNLPCEFNLKSRKRPFYRVSEEAYDSLIKLLRRFVSEDELPELTAESISAFLERMDNDGRPTSSSDARGTDGEPSEEASVRQLREEPEMVEPSDHSLFQEELGCMMLDSSGKYRQCPPFRAVCYNTNLA